MTIGIILMVIALAELGLGLWFLTDKNRNQATFWFGLFAISSAIYVGSNAFGYLGGPINPQMAEHYGWAGGALATIFFLPFTLSFPVPRRSMRELWTIIIWPLVIFIPAFIYSDLLVKNRAILKFGQGYTAQSGPYLWFFLLFVAVFWTWSIWNLIVSYRRTDGLHRQNLAIILVGTLISVIVTLFMDVYAPLTRVSHYGYVGALCTAFWFASSAYILLKK